MTKIRKFNEISVSEAASVSSDMQKVAKLNRWIAQELLKNVDGVIINRAGENTSTVDHICRTIGCDRRRAEAVLEGNGNLTVDEIVKLIGFSEFCYMVKTVSTMNESVGDWVSSRKSSRIFKTREGEEIKVQLVQDKRTKETYLEFYTKTGYDEEFDPWSYCCEGGGLGKPLDRYTDRELERLFDEANTDSTTY